jgi:hypothetical protein
VDGRAVLSFSSELFARSDVQCEASRCHVDESFLLQTFFTKRTAKFFKRLNVASFVDCFPFLQKVDQYASLTIPKDPLAGDVSVSVLRMFHPPSDTADTHVGISIHTTKSLLHYF